MSVSVPLLVISGSMGAGKTTVLGEVSNLLEQADVAHAAIDLDWLSKMHPTQGQHTERLTFANLAAAGAGRLVVARFLENRSELQRYHQSVPGPEPVVCRLTCSIETMQKRVRIREPGMIQAEAVARARRLAEILERTRTEDFTVDNGEGRSVTDVAGEILSRAGWL